jgi:hypothetical protein
VRAFKLRSFLCILLAAGSLPAEEVSGKTYANLRPEQRRLVDDWFDRLSAVTGKPIDAREGYDNTALSTRTTFDGVTHALLETTLTDRDGKPLGMALQLVLRVNEIAGRVVGARSDEQFRIYAEMAPNAYEILTKSREFRRTADNTTFHRGYPISFRGNNGAPSIQFSMTRDRRFADIDVDYRSSRFPVGLINGHLTASNSDIRAGNNDERHNLQWSGMSNWWRNLFGLPLTRGSDEDAQARVFPPGGRVSRRAPIEAAVEDFLRAWLVEEQVEAAVGYVDRATYDCLDPVRGAAVDRGMARFQIFLGMRQIASRIGKVSSLDQAAEGLTLNDPRLRPVNQPSTAFRLYDAREDLAEIVQCDKRARPETMSLAKLDSRRFGSYYVASFRLKTKEGDGEGVATLWTREDSAWKLIGFETQSDLAGFKPLARLTPESVGKTEPLAQSPGNPAMTRAARQFFNRWLIRKDLDAAMESVAASCLACVGLDRETDRPATAEAQRAELRAGLEQLAASAGRARRLNQAVESILLFHDHVKLVRHSDSDSFTIIEVPDYLSSAADCAKRTPGDLGYTEPPATVTYSGHFATAFQMKAAGKQGEIFWLLWDNTPQGWRIVSYLIQTP